MNDILQERIPNPPPSPPTTPVHPPISSSTFSYLYILDDEEISKSRYRQTDQPIQNFSQHQCADTRNMDGYSSRSVRNRHGVSYRDQVVCTACLNDRAFASNAPTC
ncbi:hypothetical protein ElyMa_005373900 [Elysia marginata]|uniref:Uncharacterized protein n=1 Tax=Elysia marginata TaxID=1093978 RepID=A0AAV4EDR4_9GAST|nr:hypothetical protein ElyMa_005373900 [Elysia marginata]